MRPPIWGCGITTAALCIPQPENISILRCRIHNSQWDQTEDLACFSHLTLFLTWLLFSSFRSDDCHFTLDFLKFVTNFCMLLQNSHVMYEWETLHLYVTWLDETSVLGYSWSIRDMAYLVQQWVTLIFLFFVQIRSLGHDSCLHSWLIWCNTQRLITHFRSATRLICTWHIHYRVMSLSLSHVWV